MTASTIVQEYSKGYIYSLILISNITILLYTSLLSMSREKNYIWRKPFKFTNVLYMFTRYTTIMTLVSYFGLEIYPSSLPAEACDVVFNITHTLTVLTYIGIQGLLVARAYALCQACNLDRRYNIIISSTLVLSFLGGLFFQFFVAIRYGGCSYTNIDDESLFILLANGFILLTDVLVFFTCLYYFWNGWRSLRIQRDNVLAFLLLRATILRFCFALIIILTLEIIAIVVIHNPLDIAAFQNSLSAVLIAEFTLDIRECENDSADGHVDNIVLPTIVVTSHDLSNNPSDVVE